MRILGKRIRRSLKVFTITLFFLIPLVVGIAMGINNEPDNSAGSTRLPPVQETDELGFEPIEIPAMRTLNSKTYDNGDGSYKAVIWINPVHYQDVNGDWNELDESSQVPHHGSRSRKIETLQPDASAGKDTMISDGGNQDMNIGADAEFWFSADTSTSFLKFRLLLQFDVESLSIPSGAEISSAKLMLYYYRSEDNANNEAGASTPITITARPISRSWVEGTGTTTAISHDGATWNDYDGANAWGSVGGDYSSSYSGSGQTPTSYGWSTVSVKDIVGAWVTEAIDNNGFILIGDNTHTFIKKFHTSDYTTASERPKLEIDFISNKAPVVQNALNKFTINEDSGTQYLNLDYEQYPDGIFKDPDVDDTLEFYVWTGSKWSDFKDGSAFDSDIVTATMLQNKTLEVVPKPNKNGLERVKLNATDDEGESIVHEIDIVITPINDPPKINDTTKWDYKSPEPTVTVGTITCEEDQYTNFTVTAYDPIEPEDNNQLIYSVNSTGDYADFFEIEATTGKVSFKAENDDVGIYYLKIMVDDGGTENSLSEYPFIIEVENVNDKPVFTKVLFPMKMMEKDILPDETEVTLPWSATEDSYYNFTLYANDEDMYLEDSDEAITVTIQPSTKFYMRTLQDAPEKIVQVSFKPTNDDVGMFTAQLSVIDLDNADTTIALKINVMNENDAPFVDTVSIGTHTEEVDSEILDLGDLGSVHTATERVPYTFTLEAVDIDPNDLIEFEISIQNRTKNEVKDMLKVTDVEGLEDPNLVSKAVELEVIPDLDAGKYGELWINVTVVDKYDAEGFIMIRVPVKNINDEPPKSEIDIEIVDAHRKTREKENLTIIFEGENVSDPDGDVLTYKWDFDDSDGISVDAEGREVEWTYKNEGTYTVTLIVEDDFEGSNTSTANLQVVKPPSSKKSSDGEPTEFLGDVGGFPILYLLIIIVVIVVVLVLVAVMMVRKKKKREEEEAGAAQAQQAQQMQQAQMMAAAQYGYPMGGMDPTMMQYQDPAMMQYQDPSMMQYQDPSMMQYQDPAMMAQYQALQQQQMMMQQQPMAYDQMAAQPMEAQAYGDMGAGTGMGYDAYGQPVGVQSQPIQPATMEGQAMQEQGLPSPGMTEQPQLPPAEPEIPHSPYEEAQTQTLEEEMGPDAVPEVAVEPDMAPPEPEVTAPETPAEETGATPTPAPAAEPEKPEQPEQPEGGKTCPNCGNAVKEGWFLCPECKKPLL